MLKRGPGVPGSLFSLGSKDPGVYHVTTPTPRTGVRLTVWFITLYMVSLVLASSSSELKPTLRFFLLLACVSDLLALFRPPPQSHLSLTPTNTQPPHHSHPLSSPNTNQTEHEHLKPFFSDLLQFFRNGYYRFEPCPILEAP